MKNLCDQVTKGFVFTCLVAHHNFQHAGWNRIEGNKLLHCFSQIALTKEKKKTLTPAVWIFTVLLFFPCIWKEQQTERNKGIPKKICWWKTPPSWSTLERCKKHFLGWNCTSASYALYRTCNVYLVALAPFQNTYLLGQNIVTSQCLCLLPNDGINIA